MMIINLLRVRWRRVYLLVPFQDFQFLPLGLMASGQAPQILERSKDRDFAYTYVIHNQVIWYLGLALRLV